MYWEVPNARPAASSALVDAGGFGDLRPPPFHAAHDKIFGIFILEIYITALHSPE